MFSNKKSLRAFIVMCVVLIALIVNGIFTLGSTRNNPVTAWQSQPSTIGVSAGVSDYVVLKVDEGETSISDGQDGTLVYMWINIGTVQRSLVKEGYCTIKVGNKTSNSNWTTEALSSTTIEIKKGVDTSKEQYQYSWYRQEFTTFKEYWQISTQDAVQINEIVFTNKDGEVLNTSLVAANVWVKSSTGNSVSAKHVEVENLPKDSTAKNVCDEQDVFQEYSNMSKKYNFTTNEATLINAGLSLLNGDDMYVDKTSGALGVELVALGMSVFGVNTLGVRIIPYIFFILTVVLLFAFGTRLFEDSDLGLTFAVFYLLLGLALSVASAGGVIVIGVFFMVLALFFMHTFYKAINNYVFSKSKHAFRAGSTAIWVPIIVSAFAYALAVNCTPSVLFALPALIAFLVAGIVRAKKVFAYNDKIASFEDEKVKNTKQYKTNTIGSAVAFVLSYFVFIFTLTILFYGINGTGYVKAYSATNIVNAIAQQFKDACFGFAGESGEFIKWIGGVGSTLIYSGAEASGKFTNVYLSMNIAVQAISLLAFILLTGFVIVNNFIIKRDAEGKKLIKTITVPYVVLTAGFIFSWLMFAFTKGANVYSYVLASTFIVGFIPLGVKCFRLFDDVAYTVKGKEVMQSNVMLWIAIIVSVVFFALGYVAFVGIEVPSIVAKILFGWWMF